MTSVCSILWSKLSWNHGSLLPDLILKWLVLGGGKSNGTFIKSYSGVLGVLQDLYPVQYVFPFWYSGHRYDLSMQKGTCRRKKGYPGHLCQSASLPVPVASDHVKLLYNVAARLMLH